LFNNFIISFSATRIHINILAHEDYGVPILDNNDVALIELAEPLRFSETVQPICLPDTHACLPEGAKCAATGWGVTDKTGISAPPNALNEVGLKEWIKDTFN
jgi:hypothetical protein